jgi:hypothetical protein
MTAARSCFRVFITTLLAAQLGALAKSAADKFFWYNYTVDSAVNTRAASASIKCDSAGNIKLAYRGHYDIKYSELKDYRWKTIVADTGTGADARMDMDLDAAGNPHIIYHDWSYNYIYYARRASDGKWSHLMVKKTSLPNLDFYQVSLAVDKDGNSHMVFTSKGGFGYANLTYAKVDKDDKVVDSAFVQNGGVNGKWNSLTVDSQGKPVAAYYNFDYTSLAVANRSDTGFVLHFVDSTGSANKHGYFASIKRQNDTSYYATYINETKGQIQLAHGSPGGTWTVENVDSLPPLRVVNGDTVLSWTLFSSQVRLALDSKGNPFVAYPVVLSKDGQVAIKSQLRLARKIDGQWVSDVVDSEGIAGEFLSLTMLPSDLPAITYWERSKGERKVAVASLTAPADTNHNGIPDYKEITGVLRQPRGSRLRAKSFFMFDPLGRYQGALTGLALPAGAYFGSEGDDRFLIK